MKNSFINPQTAVSARVYRAALNRVNEFRREAGVRSLTKLPHGMPGCARMCPIWYALLPAMNTVEFQVSVAGIQTAASKDPEHWVLVKNNWQPRESERKVWLPIARFIDEFDNRDDTF